MEVSILSALLSKARRGISLWCEGRLVRDNGGNVNIGDGQEGYGKWCKRYIFASDTGCM